MDEDKPWHRTRSQTRSSHTFFIRLIAIYFLARVWVFVRTWYCICPMATPGFVPGTKSVNHPIPFIDSALDGRE